MWRTSKTFQTSEFFSKLFNDVIMITTHTQLLNALIEKYNLKSYLEIGVQSTQQNFDKIKAPLRIGVDPDVKDNPVVFDMGSDEFFDGMDKWTNITEWDLIFIDGLHTADQVKRDFENSLRCLSDNGFILIHDVLPENEVGAMVPRETKQWWGDVYKWAMTIGKYKGVAFKTFNIDNGCMLVWKGEQHPPVTLQMETAPDFNDYLILGRKLMNVVDEVII